MSDPDLLPILKRIDLVLSEIDAGASFCSDRGYPWTLEQERRAGIDMVRALLDDQAELRTRLPLLAEILRDPEALIGLNYRPLDELKAAISTAERELE